MIFACSPVDIGFYFSFHVEEKQATAYRCVVGTDSDLIMQSLCIQTSESIFVGCWSQYLYQGSSSQYLYKGCWKSPPHEEIDKTCKAQGGKADCRFRGSRFETPFHNAGIINRKGVDWEWGWGPWLMERQLWESSVTPLSCSETRKPCEKRGTAHMWVFSDDAKHALLGIKFHSQHRGLRQATYWGAFRREIINFILNLSNEQNISRITNAVQCHS